MSSSLHWISSETETSDATGSEASDERKVLRRDQVWPDEDWREAGLGGSIRVGGRCRPASQLDSDGGVDDDDDVIASCTRASDEVGDKHEGEEARYEPEDVAVVALLVSSFEPLTSDDEPPEQEEKGPEPCEANDAPLRALFMTMHSQVSPHNAVRRQTR